MVDFRRYKGSEKMSVFASEGKPYIQVGDEMPGMKGYIQVEEELGGMSRILIR